jgi:hypothetical protein
MIDINELKKLLQEKKIIGEIKLEDIPEINLYIGQVEEFLSKNLKHLKRSSDDKILTKTMINNYTKDNLLMKPKSNKQYGKEHIILMILLLNLKQILSLDDIKSMFEVILKDMSTTEDDVINLEDIYSIFVELRNDELHNFQNGVLRNLKSVESKFSKLSLNLKSNEEKNLAEMFLLVITLIAQAQANKRLAEFIIDKYFKK